MANEKKEEAVKAPVEKVDTAAKKDTVAPATAPATVAKKATTAKKTAAKKPAKKAAKKVTPKLGKVIFEFDGQQIDYKAIEKKAAKLGGDVYVVANEKKIFDKDGKSVDLF